MALLKEECLNKFIGEIHKSEALKKSNRLCHRTKRKGKLLQRILKNFGKNLVLFIKKFSG
ncbi:hypothetical protein [Borreliella valaisiana]|uniref:hypothetical protein n=1 Tax=Borreliella valaisiana TaxID=62088 RepID=UPI002ED44A9D|nr:hypothetical protein KJD09_04350 [Borreliella valaisiana]